LLQAKTSIRDQVAPHQCAGKLVLDSAMKDGGSCSPPSGELRSSGSTERSNPIEPSRAPPPSLHAVVFGMDFFVCRIRQMEIAAPSPPKPTVDNRQGPRAIMTGPDLAAGMAGTTLKTAESSEITKRLWTSARPMGALRQIALRQSSGPSHFELVSYHPQLPDNCA